MKTGIGVAPFWVQMRLPAPKDELCDAEPASPALCHSLSESEKWADTYASLRLTRSECGHTGRPDRRPSHPGARRPVAPGPDDRGPSGDRAGRKEGPRRGPRRPTMAPAAGRGAPGLWRACNWLMGAFFALAAFVQVSAPGRRRVAGPRAPSSAPGPVRYRPSGRRGRRSRPCTGRAAVRVGDPGTHTPAPAETGVIIWSRLLTCWKELVRRVSLCRDLSRSGPGTFLKRQPGGEAELTALERKQSKNPLQLIILPSLLWGPFVIAFLIP